jgi:ankyrin repeat protein
MEEIETINSMHVLENAPLETKIKTDLINAIQRGNLDRFSELLARGDENGSEIDVDELMLDNWVLLNYAADEGQLEIVRYLVKEKAANVNRQTLWGETSLMLAARSRDLGVCEFLVENGADINLLMSNTEERALDFAIRGGSLQVIKFLCFKGASPDNLSYIGITASHARRKRIRNYLAAHASRQYLMILLSIKYIKRIGKASFVRLLTTDLIRLVCQMFFERGRDDDALELEDDESLSSLDE